MPFPYRAALSSVVLAMLVGACAGPSPREVPANSGAAGETTAPRAPKRITIATRGEPYGLNSKARLSGPGGSVHALEHMANAGLTIVDGSGEPRPQLAEAVPTLDNGLWKLFPDGRMETTWTLKAGAQWHDRAPITAEDLLFTAEVERDREVPINRPTGSDALESVRAIDGRNVVATWRRPYIDADLLFTSELASLMPRHLLEKAYREDKATFLQLPYWTTEYVGAGPYVLKEWVIGSHLVLAANPDYLLGRPRIDEIVARFIADSNTLVANVLAGAVELNLGSGLSTEQGIQIRDQWREGKVELPPSGWLVVHPQLLNPTPTVLGNVQFRRALLHAIDRQALVDTVQYGVTSVAHSILDPDQPQYREIQQSVVRYEYDPRRAQQMIEALGNSRGADGVYRDSAGARLSVELRTVPQNTVYEKGVLAVADYWQQAGVGVDAQVIAVQRARDREFRATFPAFEILGTPNDVVGALNLHSVKARLPENDFVGSNYPRYMNPEYDAIVDRYLVTIPKAERIQVLGQMIRHVADQVLAMGLFHDTTPFAIGSRLQNVAPGRAAGTSEAWNVAEWDVRS